MEESGTERSVSQHDTVDADMVRPDNRARSFATRACEKTFPFFVRSSFSVDPNDRDIINPHNSLISRNTNYLKTQGMSRKKWGNQKNFFSDELYIILALKRFDPFGDDFLLYCLFTSMLRFEKCG